MSKERRELTTAADSLSLIRNNSDRKRENQLEICFPVPVITQKY